MNDDTRALVTSLLEKHSVMDVFRMMNQSISSDTITHAEVKAVRKQQLAAGAPRIMPPRDRYAPKSESTLLRSMRAADRLPTDLPPSDKLLRRQLEVGQHYITDPARFSAACASVGLVA